MNCDQAFDQMTQLGGGADPELECHLASCRRCREMQETLSPAIRMFETDASPRVSEPWQSETVSSTDLATQTARRLTETASRRSKVGLLIGYAASVLLGAGLVWGTLLLRPDGPAAHAGWTRENCTYLVAHRPANISATQFMQNCLACHQASRPE